AALAGSWPIIIVQVFLLALWIVLNVTGWVLAWDPYPFILMNLVLSTQAAFTAPIIMMSQNRQATIDRLDAHNDYQTNLKAGQDIEIILQQLTAQNEAPVVLHEMLAQLQQQVAEGRSES
ncbi:MAG: DUF1003 domain-containing protein, partial [Anaerolineae bacterium]|nr:DUF1003 domain-containing protein [Anaerolineae bacterium]